MLSSAVFLFALLLSAAATTQPPDPIILVNCGGSSARDGRTWQPDSPSNFLFSQNSSAASATQQHPSISSDGPLMTARISPSILAYAFPVSPGPKFLRLYFYPASYASSQSNFNTSNSFFSVTANNFTLLHNFSASLHLLDSIPQLRAAYLIKEFIVTVRQNQILDLTFTPSPSSLAFINGIEIAPIPENLYIKDKDYTLVGGGTPFSFENSTALETIFRLNVGGGGGSSFWEQRGMFRRWEDDTDYLYYEPGVVHGDRDGAIKYTEKTPSYTAPEIVYQTVRSMGRDPYHNLKYNLTWVFSVDSGFYYLVRLHFCETEKFVNASNQRVFSIFVNNFTAIEEFDVLHSAGGSHVPMYLDYVVGVPQGSERKQDLWLALHPISDVIYADAILNGVEIFKLNNSNSSLSGLNPEPHSTPEQHPEPKERAHTEKSVILPVVGAVAGVVLILSLVVFFIVHRRKAKEENASIHQKSTSNSSYSATSALLPLPTDLCHRFSMPEIRAATRNFTEESVVGSGGFGTVYKGFLGSVPVAVKRLDSSSKQGTREFHTEIQMLSKLRHAHLVSLIGYCDDEGEMILVYEFMDCGNLQDQIYKAKKISLPWEKRLQICIGAAKGLHYLHTGGKHAIIHRDVKSSNILLDGNWVAKVSDFGLSRMGPMSESQTHVSTFVRGSLQYLDPEYYRRQRLTEKSDVYSFGVVLLEVVFARPPIVPTETKEKINLVQWVRKCYQSGMIYQDIDPHLTSDVQAVSLNKYMEIAESCVRDKAVERPTMSDVIWALEFCLQLQETTKENVNVGDADKEEGALIAYKEVISTNAENMFTSSSAPILSSTATISISENSFGTNNSIGVSTENVFSEIVNPNER